MDDELYVTLLRAIREHSGLELSAIRDAGTHGADSGFGGFTYTADGAEFTRANRDAVWQLVIEESEEFGHDNPAQFIASWNRADMLDGGADGLDCLLAWYALERVGQHYADRQES